MAKPESKLTLDVLKPRIEKGHPYKKIAHDLGVDVRTVKRRCSALGLRRHKDAHAIPARGQMETAFTRSSDPILSSKKMELDVAQTCAALSIRQACQDDIGVKGIDIERMLASAGIRGSYDGGMKESERATHARQMLKQWIAECRTNIDPATGEPVNHHAAILIAGHAIPVRQAGRMLGMNERRASKVCKRGLEIYARMFGWARSERRRRHAFVSEPSTVQPENYEAA